MKTRHRLFALLAMLLLTAPVFAQVNLPGTWTGEIMIGPDSFDMTFTLGGEPGSYQATLASNKLRIFGMPADEVAVDGNRITIRLNQIGAEYQGRMRLSEAGDMITFIDGDFFQEGELLPLMLRPAAE